MIEDDRSAATAATERDDGLEVVEGRDGAAVALVRGGRLQRILSLDQALLVSLGRFRTPLRTAVARTLTRLGNASSWTVAGIALLATLQPRGVHLGLRLAAGSTLATLASQALKRSLTRARPDSAIHGFEPLSANPDEFSFPSGHAAAAFAVAVAFLGEPFAAGPLAAVLATGIALSRIYLGAHYPLDVAAGGVLGVLAGLTARLLVP
ncbi:MAG TPA: phosphatase PAP2 family protein [Anaeromyxobacteraceae bacterium]|nr:phosphatase PAP2 family protein [Anaeromyxobacteraceae bacterium]